MSAVEGAPGPANDAAPVRLDVLARETFEFLQPVAEDQGRPLTLQIAGPVMVAGSASLLKRAILNLLDNAFRHTAPQVAVRLEVGALDGVAILAVGWRSRARSFAAIAASW